MLLTGRCGIWWEGKGIFRNGLEWTEWYDGKGDVYGDASADTTLEGFFDGLKDQGTSEWWGIRLPEERSDDAG
jgi:hypothetical protein